jgi:outer membrane lipoprotein SlyB
MKKSLRTVPTALRTVSVVALAAAGLVACAEPPGPSRYAPYEAGVAAHVEEGVVVSSRPIQITGQANGTGALVGGVSGAVLGSNVVSHHNDRAAGGFVGAVAGALIGSAIEKDAARQNGFAYTIRVNRTGELIEVGQVDAAPIPNGAPVSISYGAQVRVTPLYAGPPAPPPVPR